MTSQPSTALTTILFSDLVSSTELLQRAGDEDAQRIFKAHHKLLREAVQANGGHEVKWLGDGLMVAFPSAADAVRCAIAMQRSSRRSAAGERLEIRVGLTSGEALLDESDYFGTTVVLAKRLCDAAEAGHILCTALVSGLLAGRQAFAFRDVGMMNLKGITEPIAACEVLYEQDEPGSFLISTPFVGRAGEIAKLGQKLSDAQNAHGGLVMVVGEPGIGKTRTLEEFAETARNSGTSVLWGRCYEGDWAPPYGPFAEAIETYARDAAVEGLRTDLGYGAAPLARLAPSISTRLDDLAEAAPLQPDEERFRLLDGVSQFLIALAQRSAVVLVLDDIHWADRGTIAMLRHVARFAPKHRLLIIGAYRDVELDRQHPLADALAALRREAEYERIALRGLDTAEVGTLISTIAEQEVNAGLVQAISDETDGNPFFIREVLLHLVDEGKLYREDGQWRSSATSIAELGIPEGVRQVITRRLSRLSAESNKLMSAASAFNGGFRFDIISSVSGLAEAVVLDGIDEALSAQLLRPGAAADTYDFTHALIRHTLYGEMNPSRQVRLHRQIAEALEHAYGARADEHAAELVYQYHRSMAIPGAERGLQYAMAAADQAEATGAWEEVVTFLRMAVDVIPDDAPERTPTLARLGIALAWALQFDEALRVVSEVGDAMEASASSDATADYLSDAARAIFTAGSQRGAWTLARRGLALIGERRDERWAWMKAYDIVGAAVDDPTDPGIALDTPERRDVFEVLKRSSLTATQQTELALLGISPIASRQEILAEYADNVAMLTFWAGEYERSLPMWKALAQDQERQGLVTWAGASWAQLSRAQSALGHVAEAEAALKQAQALAIRVGGHSTQLIQIYAASSSLEQLTGRGFDAEEMAVSQETLNSWLMGTDGETRWVAATLRAAAAITNASMGNEAEAARLLGTLVDPLERAPGWAVNYPLMIHLAANAAGQIHDRSFDEVIERNLLAKVIEPDFRYPGTDARLAMAAVCGASGRWDEAFAWHAKARAVLDGQKARPLRAMADQFAGQVYINRGEPGDSDLARTCLDAALAEFRAIGMPGWVKQAEDLLATLA